jgi:hypothetical protein
MIKPIAIGMTALVLSGCETVRNLQAPPVRVAQSQLECNDKPSVPDNEATDNEVAVFILKQDATIDDCKRTLKVLGESLQAQGVLVIGTQPQSVSNSSGPVE